MRACLHSSEPLGHLQSCAAPVIGGRSDKTGKIAVPVCDWCAVHIQYNRIDPIVFL